MSRKPNIFFVSKTYDRGPNGLPIYKIRENSSGTVIYKEATDSSAAKSWIEDEMIMHGYIRRDLGKGVN
jgi:hypothetical protein